MTTTVTLAELGVGPLVAQDATERARRQTVLQQVESDLEALPFDAPAARAFARVASDLRRAGRKPAGRAFDAMIAAIALSRGLPVHTANPSDVMGIDGLAVVALPAARARTAFPKPDTRVRFPSPAPPRSRRSACSKMRDRGARTPRCSRNSRRASERV